MAPTLGSNNGVFAALVRADPKAWYQKPNLRTLYLCLIPAAMGVEWTSGFDGSIMNGLQSVEAWDSCMFLRLPQQGRANFILGRFWTTEGIDIRDCKN